MRLFVFGIFLFLTQSFLSAQQLELNKQLDSLFSDYRGNKPGVCVMVIKDTTIVLSRSYGMANLLFRFKITPKTNFRMASVSKQFTAMAILQLIEKKLLSFDTSLKDIFPEFPDYGSMITVKQLLTHTSGLPDYENLMAKDRTEPILDDEVLEIIMKQDSTKFKPGTSYAYSNTGYALLSRIVEKISGMKYPDYMKKYIFKPAGMSNSLIYEKEVEIPNRAYGYQVKMKTVHDRDQSLTSAVQGDGGVYTSALDYYKWSLALQNHSLISKDMQEIAYTPHFYDKEKREGYGFGWRIRYIGKTKVLSHSGHTSGFTNYVVKIPEEKLTVVLFSNRYNDDTVIRVGDYLLSIYSKLLPEIKTE